MKIQNVSEERHKERTKRYKGRARTNLEIKWTKLKFIIACTLNFKKDLNERIESDILFNL